MICKICSFLVPLIWPGSPLFAKLLLLLLPGSFLWIRVWCSRKMLHGWAFQLVLRTGGKRGHLHSTQRVVTPLSQKWSWLLFTALWVGRWAASQFCPKWNSGYFATFSGFDDGNGKCLNNGIGLCYIFAKKMYKYILKPDIQYFWLYQIFQSTRWLRKMSCNWHYHETSNSSTFVFITVFLYFHIAIHSLNANKILNHKRKFSEMKVSFNFCLIMHGAVDNAFSMDVTFFSCFIVDLLT